MEKLLTYIDTHEAELLDFWRELVRLESPSHYKAGVDSVGEAILRFNEEKLGYYVSIQEDGLYGNCIALCSCPFEEYRNGIALSAHMDTVHALGSFQPVLAEDETYLYGPGAGDCKGGIVMCLLTACALKYAGYDRRPIKLLFAADEESGGPTGRVFYPRELPGSYCMFNAESGLRGKLVTGRKSSLIAVFTIRGQAAHIGYLADKPISAIREAAKKLLALEDASDYDALTFCGGVIEGGTVATSVPNFCRLQVNVRIRDDSYVDKALRILQEVADRVYVPGTECQLEILGNPHPMSRREPNDDLCQRFSRISQQLGFGEMEPVFVGGASDAAHASALEIPVVCASGPVVDHQHTRQERALKASMAQRAKIHACLIQTL